MNTYSYEEIIDIIQNTRRFGKMTGLEVSKNMLEQLGNPQCGIPFVHVAGTNGKGSTTAFLCKILEQTGKKVGMFTSPHLITFEERIRVSGTYIPKEDVTRLGNLLLNTEFAVSPTMFDYCLAMAMLYFKEQGCDIMVIETGIGGRYDSTNALGVPELAVITKIGYDHMGVLGNTMAEIAAEKAGIIKAGSPVVVHNQQAEVLDVFRKEAESVGASHMYVTSDAELRYVEKIPMKMVGAYQSENAATAVVAARVLFEKWSREGIVHVDEQTMDRYIHTGIAETFWKGRMEIVNTQPFFMIDGAHNSHGVWALRESLIKLYPDEKFHFIMGVMADKDYEEMIEALLPLAIDFVTVTPESNRALQSSDLAECIKRKGISARYVENMEELIRPLLPEGEVTRVSSEDAERHIYLTDTSAKTVAFGSLYFIGAIETMLEENGR